MTTEEIKSKIADLQKRAANKSLPASAKKELEKMINDLKAKLPEEKKVPIKKPAPIKKAKPSAPKKDDPYKHLSCEELREKHLARMEAVRKSERKHKTLSIAEQVGNNIAHAVSKVADNIPAADIKADPEKYLERFKNLERDANQFLGSTKALMGDDYDKDELTAPIKATIGEFIKNIKAKYVK